MKDFLPFGPDSTGLKYRLCAVEVGPNLLPALSKQTFLSFTPKNGRCMFNRIAHYLIDKQLQLHYDLNLSFTL